MSDETLEPKPPVQLQAGESVEITGPAGISAKFINLGDKSMTVLLLLLLAAIMGYIAYRGEAKADERAAVAVSGQKEVKDALARYEETQRALIYIMTLPQAQRESLNLAKPKALREMQQ